MKISKGTGQVYVFLNFKVLAIDCNTSPAYKHSFYKTDDKEKSTVLREKFLKKFVLPFN